MTTYECILTEVRGAGARRIGLITLNRPKQLNALNDTLMDELGAALLAFDVDDAIGCIVLPAARRRSLRVPTSRRWRPTASSMPTRRASSAATGRRCAR
jgi:hypothetical protein